jgi:DNA invertase Pin-like site-specific DNA recombinase
MRVNGEPERWLLAARLSRVAKRDLERGDELINGIQTQDQKAAEWARREGHKIIHATKDRNVSGAMAPWERPELGPWLTDPAKVVLYDGVVAYDVSRLSREYYDLAWLRKWCEQNNKRLYVIKERLRWPDNRDGTLWGVFAERAYEERQDIIERITRELTALREAGKFIGRPPFGYASAGEKYDHYLVPTDAGRKYVPLIFQRCIDGWSFATIVEWLIAEGVEPVSGGWGSTSIGGLIKNPVYIGHRCEREAVPPDEVEDRDGQPIRYRYGDAWTETPRWRYGRTVHRCEPLIDAAIWKRANEALATRAKRGHIQDPEERAMLAEAVYCPFCEDSPMYRHRAMGRGRPYHYYRCNGRGRTRRSCGNMVRVKLVDEAVNEIMAKTFNIPVIRDEIVYGNEAEIQAELDRIDFELQQLAAQRLPWDQEDRERARLRAEHERVANTTLIDDHVEPVETDDTYLELWERLDDSERGPWLAEHEFRVTASKDSVTVSRGTVEGTAELSRPQRQPTVYDNQPLYYGKCGCGCGADVYGSRYGRPKKYVDQDHATRASYLRRSATREK